MKLYVVRHGESVLNRNKCFGGWAPTPLTDKGIADAQKAKAELKAIHFDRVYSSDLLRAVQTAQVVLPGCQPEVRENLRELSVGTFEARPVEECTRLYGDVCARMPERCAITRPLAAKAIRCSMSARRNS